MYLHLGNDVLVKKEEVVAIFDLDNSTWAYRTRKSLSKAEKNGRVKDASGGELPKSFLLCGAPASTCIYLSQYNSSTLARRMEEMELL